MRVSELAKEYDMAKSIVSTILKHKHAIKASDVTKDVTAVTKQRPQILEEVEKFSLIYTRQKAFP